MIFGVSVFLVLKSIFPSVDWSDLPRHGSATGAHRHCQRCAGATVLRSVRCRIPHRRKATSPPSPNTSPLFPSFLSSRILYFIFEVWRPFRPLDFILYAPSRQSGHVTHADKRKSTIKIKEEFWAQLFCVKQLGKDILGQFVGKKVGEKTFWDKQI